MIGSALQAAEHRKAITTSKQQRGTTPIAKSISGLTSLAWSGPLRVYLVLPARAESEKPPKDADPVKQTELGDASSLVVICQSLPLSSLGISSAIPRGGRLGTQNSSRFYRTHNQIAYAPRLVQSRPWIDRRDVKRKFTRS